MLELKLLEPNCTQLEFAKGEAGEKPGAALAEKTYPDKAELSDHCVQIFTRQFMMSHCKFIDEYCGGVSVAPYTGSVCVVVAGA